MQAELRPFLPEHQEACVHLYMQVFSLPPWNEEYESRQEVVDFFENHRGNNYFLGYVLWAEEKIIGLCIGAKKPWSKGMEYYIDQFCIHPDYQGHGLGSTFLKQIQKDIVDKGLNAILLNTERGLPAEQFYYKNGFVALKELLILAKE